ELPRRAPLSSRWWSRARAQSRPARSRRGRGYDVDARPAPPETARGEIRRLRAARLREPRTCGVGPSLLLPGYDRYLVAAIGFGKPDLDIVRPVGRNILADVIRSYRQLAVAAVDEDGQLNPHRPAEIGERIEGGADRAARKNDVVDQN